jgi:transcriptional regulator with XRE-family HTH domain
MSTRKLNNSKVADIFVVVLDTAKMRALREKLYPSQKAAAEAAQMGTAQAWSKIEAGDGASVTLKTVGKIARALKVPAKDLLK